MRSRCCADSLLVEAEGVIVALRPGEMLAGYRIERALGSGGMSTVYLAKHPTLPRFDAIKVLSAELSRNVAFRRRFEQEADLVAGFSHPNIVTIHNRGETDGHLWIAMQFIDGADASDEVGNGPSVMTPERAIRIVVDAAGALDYAHSRGIVHRDIKPANLLLTHEVPERVFVTDFGVAKALDAGAGLTATGEFLATVAYAPPEQLSGQQVDRRADIYALGGTLVTLLTGRHPFEATNPTATIMAHLNDPPPRPSEMATGLPTAIDQVIAVAMAKDPAARFPSAGAFAAAATDALAGRLPARVAPTVVRNTSRSPTRSRRPKVLAALALVAVAVVAAGTTFALTGGSDAPPVAAPSSPTATTSLLLPCESKTDGNTVIGNGPGGTDSGPDAIMAFQYSFYVSRDATRAWTFVAPDAAIPPASAIQTGIDRTPVGTSHCLTITGVAPDRYDVDLIERHPDQSTVRYQQTVLTRVVDGRTLLTALAAR